MTIYTKKGDRGETYLLNGKKVSKDDLVIETFGSCDELSSYIGYTISYLKDSEDKKILMNIQKYLYLIMSYLSGVKIGDSNLEIEVKKFEQYIDKESLRLPNLNRFIIPSGLRVASLFHILRVHTRKCERRAVSYFIKTKRINKQNERNIIKYLNRLSDMFFIFARKYSKGKEILT